MSRVGRRSACELEYNNFLIICQINNSTNVEIYEEMISLCPLNNEIIKDKVANVTIGILYNHRVGRFQICHS